jgi:hypothetical protein
MHEDSLVIMELSRRRRADFLAHLTFLLMSTDKEERIS